MYSFGFIGKFFNDWMSCHITAADIKHPPTLYPAMKLHAGINIYECIQTQIKNFCSRNKIKNVGVLKHHIVLRSTSEEDLPPLSTDSAKCGKNQFLFNNLIWIYH